MSNENTRLLSTTEQLDIYGVPVLNDAERTQYFTFNDHETTALNRFDGVDDAVYFAVCLVFFKIRLSLIKFNYRDITLERQHVMKRYFPNKASPKSLPKHSSRITRIENQVLELRRYHRFADINASTIKKELFQYAPNHPRQRQLCKALLDLFVKHRVAIAGYTTIQTLVSEIWNKENNRVVQAFLRYTSKSQRQLIFSLLDKTDGLHHIISIKQDMKGFNTTELNAEIDKNHQLLPIFNIAKTVLPKLGLPKTTINYYSDLINHYSGPRLKQISAHSIQLYLMCYCFTRFQMLQDNLLEAFKKRTLEYQTKGVDYAKEVALEQIERIKETREKVSNLLVSIKQHPDSNNVPRPIIHQHVPEDELLIAAKLLVGDNLNKELLFWQYIDSSKVSIRLNLKHLFLTIDFEVTHNHLLKEIVDHMKKTLADNTFYDTPLPPVLESWVSAADSEYVMPNEVPIYDRFEYLFYKRMVYYLTTNKLTLKYSKKYKTVEDDLVPPQRWKKKKRAILKELGYNRLSSPLKKTLDVKKKELNGLYNEVNQALVSGENQAIKIVVDKDNKQQWRLRPLEKVSDPNESLFANFQQSSIVDVLHFVNRKTKFTTSFESVLPRSTKIKQDKELIMAAILANAIRLGSNKMASISDLNESALLTAEADYVRIETLIASTDCINNAAAKIPIYHEWYINGLMHASLDGLKLETSLRNVKSRRSPKYFGQGLGVSSYNEIFNSFPLASLVIGANEYEGHFLFEMVHHQNSSEIKPHYFSTDKHGTNAINFCLFDLTDLVFAPRIPKPHRETFWAFGNAKDYEGCIIKPTKFVDEKFLISEWNNMQHVVSSLLLGGESPSSTIRKIASGNYHSDTKRALVQYNHIVRSHFLLQYLHDSEFRRAILIALNRGEAFNNLYRAITVLRKGEFRGFSEIEMEIWNQCTRLISSVILYYNTYILNELYQDAKDEAERAYLIGLSPGAWVHVNMLGFYQFHGKHNDDNVDNWIRRWDWGQDRR
ncbi:MAG: Tn3 family transposase [Pseudomonadales bacterium]|nr:Tn3 family transposase [Pseudomonadales bacterium]MBL4867526.1 Tn3 family transposase [Pseudomonadales bacterium]MBL4867801.1 Tn3 family transposase [Pseudomonadales bacterium]